MFYPKYLIKDTPTHFPSRRSLRYIQRQFQLKYTARILSSIGIGLLLFLIPIYYFTHETYNIFSQLAYDTSPILIENLEQEWLRFNIAIGVCFISIMIICIFIGMHYSGRMIGPLSVLERHLKEMTYGQWNMPDIRIRTTDEFQELVQIFNYFYNSLRANTKAELDLLNKISLDPKNKEAFEAWQQLIFNKSIQLNIEVPSKISSNPEAHDWRHAS